MQCPHLLEMSSTCCIRLVGRRMCGGGVGACCLCMCFCLRPTSICPTLCRLPWVGRCARCKQARCPLLALHWQCVNNLDFFGCRCRLRQFRELPMKERCCAQRLSATAADDVALAVRFHLCVCVSAQTQVGVLWSHPLLTSVSRRSKSSTPPTQQPLGM